MAEDANLRCNQFKCTMALSYCAVTCPHALRRGGTPCPDVASFSTDNAAKMRSVVAATHASGKALSQAFKTAFPSFLPDGVAAPTPAPVPVVSSNPNVVPTTTTPAPRSEASAALERRVPTARVSAPKPTLPPKKEKTMSPDPETKSHRSTSSPSTSGVQSDPNVAPDAPKPRGKGGLRKGQKINRKKKTEGISGLAFFIETEKNSGLFSLIPEPTMSEFLMMRAAGRRVIGTTEAKEL